jgi:tetratricopeptide (TPR) repeat protein
MLSGQPPFTGTIGEIILAHAQKEPIPMSVVRSDIPRELAVVVSKMMAKDLRKRYSTPQMVVTDLAQFANENTFDGQTSAPQKRQRIPSVPIQTESDTSSQNASATFVEIGAEFEIVQNRPSVSCVSTRQSSQNTGSQKIIPQRPYRVRNGRRLTWLCPAIALSSLGLLFFGLWSAGAFSPRVSQSDSAGGRSDVGNSESPPQKTSQNLDAKSESDSRNSLPNKGPTPTKLPPKPSEPSSGTVTIKGATTLHAVLVDGGPVDAIEADDQSGISAVVPSGMRKIAVRVGERIVLEKTVQVQPDQIVSLEIPDQKNSDFPVSPRSTGEMAEPESRTVPSVAADNLAEDDVIASTSVTIGKKTFSPEELGVQREEARKILASAVSLLESRQDDEAIKTLKNASRIDPISCRADFILAMGYAIAGQKDEEFKDADQRFKLCLDRMQEFQEFYGTSAKTNMAAILNNLALVQLRMGNHRVAIGFWEKISELEIEPHNTIIGNYMHAYPFLNAASESRGKFYFKNPSAIDTKKYWALGEKWSLSRADFDANNQRGWHYQVLQTPQGKPDPIIAKLKLPTVDEKCLGCHGTTRMNCSNSRCNNGTVVEKQPRRVEFLLPNGSKAYQNSTVNVIVDCTVCNGVGKLECDCCAGRGIEIVPK